MSRTKTLWDETENLQNDKASELVVALVAPMGVDTDIVTSQLEAQLRSYEYETTAIKVSRATKTLSQAYRQNLRLPEKPEGKRIRAYMDGANKLRGTFGNEILIANCIAGLADERDRDGTTGAPLKSTRRAIIFSSLKHPAEVHALRAVYGEGLFIVAISATAAERDAYFQRRGVSVRDAEELIQRDEDEDISYGQRTRDAFELADVFMQQSNAETEIARFLRLLLGAGDVTPTRGEYAMFLAYAASLRSGDLSRQVGAVVWRDNVGVIGTGCNDVPRSGGGLYWPDDPDDERDLRTGFDANAHQKRELILDIVNRVTALPNISITGERVEQACGKSKLVELTEYGRAVHAEMDAMLACLRAGISTVGATLYCTTFPCHNCAKHLIAAGFTKVIFVEPYPKSKALDLHGDAIGLDVKNSQKVSFSPFTGVGPRRYVDLFSLKWSAGRPLSRKENGILRKHDYKSSALRMPMRTTSYLDREKELAAASVNKLPHRAPLNGTAVRPPKRTKGSK